MTMVRDVSFSLYRRGEINFLLDTLDADWEVQFRFSVVEFLFTVVCIQRCKEISI